MTKHDLDNGRKTIVVLAGYARSLVNFRGPLLQSLVAAEVSVHAAAPDLLTNEAVCTELKDWGIVPHDIPLGRTGINPIQDVKTLLAQYRLCRLVKPDAVMCYTIKPVIYGTLAAWLARVPLRFVLITGLGYAFTGAANGKRKLVQRLARSLYRHALKLSHRVFFQNPDDQALFQQLGLLPSHVPSTVVNGSGIDLTRFEVAPLPEGSVSFLLIARLLGDKGVREYVAAAERIKLDYPQAVFRLVGYIDSNPDSISQAELDVWMEHGTVEYLGRLDDVRPAIALSSVYVLPSYREGTPRTVLEAMAIGRPVITTDAPGCRETVVDGENGFLIPVKAVDALADVMRRFLDDPSLMPTMGRRSRQIAEEKYDVHKVNAAMLGAMGVGDNYCSWQ